MIGLLVAALLVRGITLGHPLLHMDENFYLLVGDRMVHDGAWPYVDIWDRKPVGLFVLFAAFRMLGGDGFIHYQIAALLAVTATAWILYRLAARSIGHWPAFAAGVFYIAGLTFFGGYGGQAPVFFNALMAMAALCLVKGILDTHEGSDRPDKRILWTGIACMLCVGLAIQIKYSVVFEGFFFGLILIFAGRNLPFMKLVSWALIWIMCALFPTLVAWSVYVIAGYNDAFVYANFISIFQRESSFDATAQKRLMSLLGLLAPLLILSFFAWRLRAKLHVMFALGWLGFALIGVFVMGTYYNHYGLPLVLPASLTAAIGLSSFRWKPRVIVTLAIVVAMTAGTVGTFVKLSRKGDAKDIEHLLTYVPRDKGDCPWLMGTLGATLYLQSKTCLPTRYPLSGHLFERHEAKAVGVDQNDEIDAILAKHPSLITMDQTPRPEEDLQQRARFLARLNPHYRLAEVRDIGKTGLLVYVRKGSPPQ